MTAVPLALDVRLTLNETAKGLRLAWRRRSLVVTGVVLLAVNYTGFSLFIGGGHIVRPLATSTLPALLAVAVATTAALQGSGGIAEEINGGTLEQTQLSPAPPVLQVLGRLGGLAAEGLAAAVVLGVGFTLGFGLHYHYGPAALLPALLTVLDGLGYGLLIVALTMRVASIGAITHVFNMAVMFFGGMVVPVALFPSWLETFARFVPTTLGVQVLEVTLSGRPLSTTWKDGTLPWLLVHVAASFALGLAAYVATIRRARSMGGLSPR